uniref:Ubiquitin thioesterase OTU n=1 Tax=Hirondellea gigas TaxID=1518452 RepID=A0A6A7G4Q4_9CRUS
MSTIFRLRVRSALQQNIPLIDFLTPESTFENLNQVLASASEIPEQQLKVLCGYPPKVLQGARESMLQEIGIKNGEVLIIEKRSATDPPQYCEATKKMTHLLSNLNNKLQDNASQPKESTHGVQLNSSNDKSAVNVSSVISSSKVASEGQNSNGKVRKRAPSNGKTSPAGKKSAAEPSEIVIEREAPAGIYLAPGSQLGILQKREVPSDNSCLFASMDYVLNGSISSPRTKELRREVSEGVLQEEELIPDCVMDRPRQEYSTWIMREQSWGGEIELAILSKYHKLEIVTVDAKTARVNRFGESENYKARVFLLYDGIHYDPLHMENLRVEGKFFTSFPGTLDAVLAQAVDMAGQAHQSGSFTDTDNFTLQCGECGHKLKGEAEALQHAKQTTHTDFQEVTASS